MALLLLRHAMSVTDGEGGEEEDPSAMFSVSSTQIDSIPFIYAIIKGKILESRLLTSSHSAAFLAKGGGLSFAMLHHGLGNQHFAAAKTKRG